MMAHDPSLFAGGAALNALDELETAQFARHLDDCPTCQVELSGFAETAARLGAASAEAPPASMRTAVLAAVAITRQLPPQTDRTGALDNAAPVPPVGTGRPEAEVVDLASRRRQRSRWLLIAAAAAVIALVGLSVFQLNRPGSDDAQDLRQCVTGAADREVVPSAAGSTGETTTVVSASCGGAVLTFADVPALDAGKTYQLWVISGDQTRSVTTMNPATDGSMPEAVAAVQVGDTALGLTVEPAGGSPVPTTPPVITVPLSS